MARMKKVSIADPKAYEATMSKGLYLVSNCLFQPFTNEQYYLVKVGKATHLNDRMRAYDTYNPMLYHIDYYPININVENKAVDTLEKVCHRLLRRIAIDETEIRAKEWFRVSRETYLEICDKGFTFFGL